MDEILKVDTVGQYNDLYGFETLHPQVAVVDLNKPESQRRDRMTLGFYSLFLKETKGCVMNYGKSVYDFDAETIVAVAPGQTVGYSNDYKGPTPKTVGLVFHPDFIRGTTLGQEIGRYTFFSYESNEALHLSEGEVRIVQDILSIIRKELLHAIDRHTRELVCTNIKLLLDYCLRFYDRQFVTRQDMNRDVLSRFERLLNDYLASDRPMRLGLPAVNYFAEKVCLSSNYFGDLVKRETGQTAKEYIQLKMLGVAKERLLDPSKSITQVAYMLGFQYPQHFVRFFKNMEGVTPTQYKRSN